ncbi:unnamed protein product [Cladocopium goreaui]|uniref:Ultraviolet-B receptor UVR8 n=1 Tax=Cladocopium goreaui TaxID=2562237 RepID=A0A9P1D532_9DINO|nr:unnamed protein product [Cladocopium goreaui]|mmetsp:Transcript_31686/g.68160  ORF Transcript_31686/g.68160 Transcript_31686/m.68160 type:complete len:216 (-) Transcript_31686:84-731(-)
MHQQQQWNQSWNDGWSKGYDPYQSYGKGYASYDDSYGGSYSVPDYSHSKGGGYNMTSDKGGKGRQEAESGAPKEIKGLVRSIIQAQAMPDGRGSEESTIFVAGLPSDMTNLEMYQLFSAFGAIAHRGATALQDKESGKCTGIGFVNFIESDSAQKAIRALNSFPFLDGSWLTVKKKGPPKEKEPEKGDKGKGDKGKGDKGEGKGKKGKGKKSDRN